MSSKESSSSSLTRKIPILNSSVEYMSWKPMMEQYIVYLGLQDVLKMKFSSWQSIVKMIEESEKKQNSSLYSRLGIEYTETAQVAVIKSESEQKEAAYQNMSEDETKTLKKVVKSV